MENLKKDTLTKADSLTLAKAIAGVLIEKKAVDVAVYSVSEESSVTDYYVNATGRSSTQVCALADEVIDKISLEGRDSLRVEGRSGKSWILVDFGDVIVNVFDRPSREFYNFDRLMPQNGRIDLEDVIAEIDKKYDVNKKED